jgi:hypothetical protein
MKFVRIGLASIESSWHSQKILGNFRIYSAMLLAFLPFGIWLVLILRYGVNIPYQDQWDARAPQIEDYFAGQFTLDMLFQQFNELRPVFPRLLSLILAILTHQWNTRGEMLLGLSLTGLISLLALLLLIRTNPERLFQNLLILVFFNGLLLSPASWYFRLFSITSERLLIEICLLVNVFVYTLPMVPLIKVAFFIMAAFIAQYSHSGGIVVWPLTLALVLALTDRSQPKKKIIFVYLLFFALSCFFYFWHYKTPPQHTSFTRILDFSALDIVRFALAFLGNPFSNTYNSSAAIGLVLLSSFVLVAFFSLLEWHRKGFVVARYLLPWLVLGVYSISQAILATITRLPMSQGHALRPDYIIHPIYLPLATLALLVILSNKFSKVFLKQFLLLWLGLLIVIFVNYSLRVNHFQQLLAFHHSLQHGKACAQLINFYDSESCLKILYPKPNKVPPHIRRLDELELIQPGLVKSLAIDSSLAGKGGYVELLEETSQGIRIKGWAILEQRPADAVVIIYEPQEQTPRIVHILKTGRYREDVVKILGEKKFARSGWSGTIQTQQLPAKANLCSLNVYGFDSERNRFIPLNRSLQIGESCQK